MRRAVGGCIDHSETILESGAHNLLHSTTQTSTKGQRSCIRGPRHNTVKPGQLGRLRARIDLVAPKKVVKKQKKEIIHARPGMLFRFCGFRLCPAAEKHPVAAAVLRACSRLDRDLNGSSVDVCRGFPLLGCRDRSSQSLWLKGVGRRASHNHATEHQTNKPHESPLVAFLPRFAVLQSFLAAYLYFSTITFQ